jgi:hypothetical protein
MVIIIFHTLILPLIELIGLFNSACIFTTRDDWRVCPIREANRLYLTAQRFCSEVVLCAHRIFTELYWLSCLKVSYCPSHVVGSELVKRTLLRFTAGRCRERTSSYWSLTDHNHVTL